VGGLEAEVPEGSAGLEQEARPSSIAVASKAVSSFFIESLPFNFSCPEKISQKCPGYLFERKYFLLRKVSGNLFLNT
jgi:hypothetical protein